MRQIMIHSCIMISSSVCFALLFGGCMSIPISPTPRFYVLQTVDENQVSKKKYMAPDVLIGIGPIKVPEYQDRPQIVTQGKDKLLKFAQFDRWGESLGFGVTRLIREDLSRMLKGASLSSYPWNPAVPIKYQVAVEIIQLDSELDKNLFCVVQWMIIDPKNMRTLIIKRSEFQQPIIPQDYFGLTKTLSAACVSLSNEISEAVATLETRPKITEDSSAL